MIRLTQEGRKLYSLLFFFFPFRYKKGGVKSGFRHVDRDSHTNRLLKIKGRRTVRIQEVNYCYITNLILVYSIIHYRLV